MARFEKEMDARQSSPVGGAAFRDAFGGAFSWCKVCKKHLAMATCGAGWCAQCYASAAQGSIMLTLAVHDAAGCKCRGRGAQTGSLLSPPGAASSATTPPGAYAQALGAAALPQATRVAFGQCQYLVFAGLSKDGRRQKRPRTTRVQSSASLVACPHVEPAVVRWAATPSGPVFACCCDRRSLAQFEVLASGGTAEDLEQLDNGFTSCLHTDHAREALRGTCIGAKAVAFTPQPLPVCTLPGWCKDCVAACLWACGFAGTRAGVQVSDMTCRTIGFVPLMYPLYG